MRPAVVRVLIPPGRLSVALLMLLTVLVVGTVGYMTLAGMTFVDALYQTVTTVSTVGFRELKPFGTPEKLFTMGLILAGVGTVLYTLTLTVQLLLESDVRSRLYQRRMKVQIETLERHYILCGFGRVGQEIARELRERGVDFVTIEANPEQVALARDFGYLVIEGDASEERTLNQAGVGRARCLLAASDSDSGNTFITLTAKSMNPSCYVVARVASPYNEEKLKLAGADRVLSLYILGGRRMVLAALQPLAADFMDTLAAGRHGDLLLVEFEVNETNGLAGQTCQNLVARAPNATILGIRRASGQLVVGPRGLEELQNGDILIVLAEETDVRAMSSPAAEGAEARAG